MTLIKDKLMEAIEAKNNDIKSFVWKLAKNSEGVQKEIKLVDATPEQLKQFYNHCQSMLHSTDTSNPGRYVLLDIINEQRKKCNIELYLRKLESGEISIDKEPYPRHLYIQDLNVFMNNNRSQFPIGKLKEIPITRCPGKLPKEFARLSVRDVLDGCTDGLGLFDNKHITFSFILNLGVYLTPAEMKELDEKDADGNTRSKLEVLKERLNLNQNVRLTVKPTGLNFTELRAVLTLYPKKYSAMTTDQLLVLRNKVLFRLENEVSFHIEQWEERIRQIELVATNRGIDLSK